MPDQSFYSSQRGNVLVYILIAVALFAALGFAMSNMMRGGAGESISREKSQIYASGILSYAQSIKDAVNLLRISGACEDEQLSFEKAPFDGTDSDYVNPNSPNDFSCHVFHPNGGGAPYMDAIDDVGPNKGWFFGVNRVGNLSGTQNLGTNANDLVAILLDIDAQVCDRVNKIANGLETWESGGAHNRTNEFQGDFTNSANGINADSDKAVPAGCFCDIGGACTAAAPRYFYYTILVR